MSDMIAQMKALKAKHDRDKTREKKGMRAITYHREDK